MSVRRSVVLLVFAAVALVAQDAGATASTYVWGPSTDLQRFRTVHVTDDVYLPVRPGATGAYLPSVTNLGLTLGVLPFRKLNLEIGVDQKTGYGALDANPVYLNAKFGIPEGAWAHGLPAIAAGILDAGTKRGATDYDVVYVEAARSLGVLGRASLGYFAGNRRLLLNAGGGKDNAGFLFGWQRSMPELSDRLSFLVDGMGTHSPYGTLNFGGSWRFTDRMNVLAGYVLFNESRVSPNMVTLQADVDFDLGGGK